MDTRGTGNKKGLMMWVPVLLYKVDCPTTRVCVGTISGMSDLGRLGCRGLTLSGCGVRCLKV